MCGRFTQSLTIAEIQKLFNAKPVTEVAWNPSFNIPPTAMVPVITEQPDGESEMRLMRFGYTVRIPGGKMKMLPNLKSETALSRKDAVERRCIIPATGFYEWDKATGLPYYYSPPEGSVFRFAGLWHQHDGIDSFAILTTEANKVVAPVHHRMPVILSHNTAGVWLGANTGKDDLQDLLQPLPDSQIKVHRVGKAVGNVRNNLPSLIDPLVAEGAAMADLFNSK